MDAAGQVTCFESGWCDYSDEHSRVRKEAESLIQRYVEGRDREYWMTVIVAPYGSGKSTLLKHLNYYAGSLGVRSAVIEFASIVNYIVEAYGSIHESQLPGIIEEYVERKLDAKPGQPFVLLIDEIEESYDLFRGIVEHETSPLRGLAEAVRTHRTWVYPVLAFGPSSTLKEAVFGPVAWRSRVLTIPLIPKPVVAAMLDKQGIKGAMGELVANTIWWASKGRTAWVQLLVDQLARRLVEAAEQGPESLESLLMSDEALSREILEGVPLFDRSGYRDVKRFVENKKLLPYLAAFAGPIPSTLLEALIGEPVVPEAGLVYGITKSLVLADELLSETEAWMERIARSKGIPSVSIEHAISALEHVVNAWSLDGKVPFDPQGLRDLFAAAADLAREIYGDDPSAAQLLESINPDLVVPEIKRSHEAMVYLRPSVLVKLYPSATNNPLVGCAKRSGLAQVVDVVESLAPEEIANYSSMIARLLGLEEVVGRQKARLIVAPARLVASLQEQLCGDRAVVVIANARNDVHEEKMPQWLRSLEELGLVSMIRAGPRLSMFLYALFYNYAMGTQNCSLDRLDSHERRVLNLYGDSLKSLIVEAAYHLASGPAVEAEKLISRLLGTYGDAGVAAAARLALLPPSSRRRIEEAYREVRAAATTLATMASLPIPRLPDVIHAADELAKLPVLEAISVLPDSCAVKLPEPLRLLHPTESRKSEPKLLPRLRQEQASIGGRREGVLGAVANTLSRLIASLETLWSLEHYTAMVVEDTLEDLVVGLSGRLEKALRMIEEVEAKARSLPEPVSAKALEAIHTDMSGIRSIDSLISYLGTASAALEEIERLATNNELIEEIDTLKRRLVSMIKLFLDENVSPLTVDREATTTTA